MELSDLLNTLNCAVKASYMTERKKYPNRIKNKELK